MKKKLGVGSTSLLFFILTLLWSLTIKELDDFCLGDKVLNGLGLPVWSNGLSDTHYTIFYSVIFLIPAIIISNKFPDHLFAKFSKTASVCLFLLLLSLCLIFMI